MNLRLCLAILLTGTCAAQAHPDDGWVAMGIGLGLYALAGFILAVIATLAGFIAIPYWVAVGFQARRYRKENGRTPPRAFWLKRWILFMASVMCITVALFSFLLWPDMKKHMPARRTTVIPPRATTTQLPTWPDTLLMSITQSMVTNVVLPIQTTNVITMDALPNPDASARK